MRWKFWKKKRPLAQIDAPHPLVDWKEQTFRLESEKRHEQAFQIYQQQLEADPDQIAVVFERGRQLAKQSLWREAEAVLRLVCKVRPDAESWILLGEVLEKVYYSFIQEPWAIEKLEEAFQAWREGLKIDNQALSLYLRLGSMLMVTGRIDEAREIFARYLQIREERLQKEGWGSLEVTTISSIPNGIGHITLLDYFVKMRELGLIPRRQTLVLASSERQVNRAFLDYWKKWDLQIIDQPEAVRRLEPLSELVEEPFNVFATIQGKVHLVYHAIAEVERRWKEAGKGALLKLDSSHREQGWEILQKIGVPKDGWFVTLHVRESGYTGEADVPPNNHRNSDILTYLEAAQKITQAGGWVIRLGDSSMKRLPEMERVFDYAHSPYKSDWMDVFLCAENRFYLGTSSGPCMIPPCFGKKCALANYELFTVRPFYFDNIYLTKLIFDDKKGRLRTFAECFGASTANCYHSNFYYAQGVRFINNSSDEIVALVEEMMESVGKGVQYTSEDDLLQCRFNELALSFNAAYGTNSRLGSYFLHKHRSLLD